MPDQTVIDQTALDYGVLLAGIKEKLQEKAVLENAIEAAAQQRTMLNDEIAKAEEAKVRLRQEVIELEKQKEAVAKVQNEEIVSEKRLVEDQRQKLARATAELAEVEEALNKRKAELEGRERALREAQNINESKGRALIVEAGRIDNEKVQMTVRENLVNERERAAEQKEMETEEKLKKALIAESNQKSALETSRTLAKKASDDNLGAQAKLNEIKDLERRNEEALKQIQLFCEVADEALLYMKNNVKNWDAIENYFKEVFPAVVSRSKHV